MMWLLHAVSQADDLTVDFGSQARQEEGLARVASLRQEVARQESLAAAMAAANARLRQQLAPPPPAGPQVGSFTGFKCSLKKCKCRTQSCAV